MAECNAGALAAGVHNQQAGGGLYIFFKKLAEFAKAPVALVFVLDGPERPPMKRGHEVRHQPIWWIELAIELVEIFGYQIHRVSAVRNLIDLSNAQAHLCRHRVKQRRNSPNLMPRDIYMLSSLATAMPLYLERGGSFEGE
jgi:hypothetical protein